MSDVLYERDYAQQMLFAALESRAEADCGDDIEALLEQALDAGCGRTELIIELANIGARLAIVGASDAALTRASA